MICQCSDIFPVLRFNLKLNDSSEGFQIFSMFFMTLMTKSDFAKREGWENRSS